MTQTPSDVLIIGAGVTGLSVAESLRDHKLRVEFLEKRPVAGGRLAQKQIGHSLCDSGAQFFTARAPSLRDIVTRWERNGWVTQWFTKPDGLGGSEPTYASPLGFGGLMQKWAKDFEIQFGAEVAGLEINPETQIWHVKTSDHKTILTRSVAVTLPWPEPLSWLKPWVESLSADEGKALASISIAPGLALLLSLDTPPKIKAPGIVFEPTPHISCVVDQSAKGIEQGECGLVIMFSPEFSVEHQGKSPSALLPYLLQLAGPWIGASGVRAVHLEQWPLARVLKPFGKPYVRLPAPAPLFLCGDGFLGPRVEAAWLSGEATAMALIESLGNSKVTA